MAGSVITLREKSFMSAVALKKEIQKEEFIQAYISLKRFIHFLFRCLHLVSIAVDFHLIYDKDLKMMKTIRCN